MKNKALVLLKIAIVLCSVLLVATLPAIAAEQTMQRASASEVTTTSEDDFVLGIYGNANEDDTIDMRDLTYVKLIFFGKKPETELADAKYDGKINPLDFVQIKLIIVGKEKEITLIDAADRIVTVSMPVKRICTQYEAAAGAIRSLGGKERIVGVGNWLATKRAAYYPELSKRPVVGGWAGPDIEKMLELKTEVVITYPMYGYKDRIEDTGIKVVCFLFGNPEIIKGEVKKLGYLLNERETAVEYIKWYEGIMSEIEEKTAKISEENKPRVFLDTTYMLGSTDRSTVAKGTGLHWICIKAGGINIAADIIGKKYPKYPKVSAEWVLVENPDIIVGESYKGGYTTDDITELKEMYDDITGLFNATEAVKNNKVYIMSGDVRWGLQVPIAVAYMAKWFHPAFFDDLTIQRIQEMNQEFIDRFCPGLEFDVTEHGAFVYPAELKE